MRFAAISDVHGNHLALEAVLRDIRREGVRDIVNLGDMASGPLEARAAMDLLMSLNAVSVLGNHDRWLIDHSPASMGQWERVAYEQLDNRHLDWLRTIPHTRVFQDHVFLCHATPIDDNVYWLEAVAPDGAVTMAPLEIIERMAGSISQSLILCGHTHIARTVRLLDGRTIVNPGSVGIPGFQHHEPYAHLIEAGTPLAAYALLELRPEGWQVSHRGVPYDNVSMSKLARERGELDVASALATGWVR